MSHFIPSAAPFRCVPTRAAKHRRHARAAGAPARARSHRPARRARRPAARRPRRRRAQARAAARRSGPPAAAVRRQRRGAGSLARLPLSQRQQARRRCSICTTAQGARRFAALCAGADVLLENFGPNRRQVLDLAPEAVRERFPHLVHVAIADFGLSGPRAHWRAEPLVAFAGSRRAARLRLSRSAAVLAARASPRTMPPASSPSPARWPRCSRAPPTGAARRSRSPFRRRPSTASIRGRSRSPTTIATIRCCPPRRRATPTATTSCCRPPTATCASCRPASSTGAVCVALLRREDVFAGPEWDFALYPPDEPRRHPHRRRRSAARPHPRRSLRRGARSAACRSPR